MESLINNCKTQIKLGLRESADINWLNKTCEILRDLCNSVQQSHIYKTNSKSTRISEKILLSIHQIVCCVKYLEETLNLECDNYLFLLSTREHFIDRIIWCTDEIFKSLMTQVSSFDSIDSVNVEENFVYCMDALLDSISPLTLFNKDSSANKIDILEIQHPVKLLLSHAITFTNLALCDDQKPLSEMCQNVFAEWKLYEEKLRNDGEKQEQSLQLQASSFESSLYQLDTLINDCLLRLILQVFVDIQGEPIDKLRHLIISNVDKNEIGENIEQIDDLSDRLLQIGMFGIAFSSDYRIKCTINSSLASLEALDSFLIPSIQSKSNDFHSKLLEKHWNNEVTTLSHSIHSIIDTNALCSAVIELLQKSINKMTATKYERESTIQLLAKCNVLLNHLTINSTDLKLSNESMRKIHYEDIKLMIKECSAAVEKCKENEINRIVKRFKILLSSIKKFQKTLPSADDRDVCQFVNVVVASGTADHLHDFSTKSISDSMKGLNSMIGTNSSTVRRYTILYESTRRQMTLKRGSKVEFDHNFSSVKAIKKRSSLRVAMFKRATNMHLNQIRFCNNMTDSLSLHITDILEEIKDLSCTLQK